MLLLWLEVGNSSKVNVEKPLFKLHGKPLIKYVLDNIYSSKLVEDVVIAVSPHTQETIKYLKSLNGNFQILNTSGIDYLNDLSYILTLLSPNQKRTHYCLLMLICRLSVVKLLILY